MCYIHGSRCVRSGMDSKKAWTSATVSYTHLDVYKRQLQRKQAMKMFEIIVEKEGLEFLCWRKVPTNPGICLLYTSRCV